jgi:hypothetical protein
VNGTQTRELEGVFSNVPAPERDILTHPITEIKAPQMLDAVRMTKRSLEMGAPPCPIFRPGYLHSADHPVPSFTGAQSAGHHPAITPDELPEFLRVLD